MESIWTLAESGGVQLECVGECKVHPASQPHPPHSDYRKPGGSQEGISTDQNKPLMCAYLVDADIDPMTDGGAVNSNQHSSSTGVVDDDSPMSFAALGTMLHVPPTSA